MSGQRTSGSEAGAWSAGPLTATVVLCAYTPVRWTALCAAVASVETQSPHEVIVVIDHHPELLARATAAFGDRHQVLPNAGARGLAEARNTGLASARGEIVVFLDDDAVALPGWLPALLQAYQDKRVLGVGGKIEPLWEAGFPAWFPSEFLWVVGCTYAGLPDHAGPVRNVIGANMSVRRDVAQSVGGFRSNLGRVGRFPLGGEETEFCIRTARHFTEHHWQYQPLAAVLHRVPPERATWRYFLTRCFAEGLTKARVSRATGTSDGLASERQHVARTLPLAVLREIGAALRGHPAALGRAVALVTGTLSAGVGYLVNPLIERREQAGMARPTTSSSFEPVRVMEVSLDEALPQVLPRNPDRDLAYRRAQVLVKLHDAPLGMVRVSLPEAGLSADQLAALIWQALGQDEGAPIAVPADLQISAYLSPPVPGGQIRSGSGHQVRCGAGRRCSPDARL